MTRQEKECLAIEHATQYARDATQNHYHTWADWLLAFERELSAWL